MKVGDLVRHRNIIPIFVGVGVITCIDPEGIGDEQEVEVLWSDGECRNHSTCYLEVISESR